ncbi:MAG: LCP family protein [Candidatus Limnocylindrales bacterium]
MEQPRDDGRQRSPFAAAFLSFVFPGLGQAYAGDPRRGLVLALPPLALLIVLVVMLVDPGARLRLEASLSSPTVLIVVLGLDIALLLYRLVAVVDAFRRAGGRLRLAQLSVAGLLAVLLVTPLAHVALAHYDLLAYDLVTSIGNAGGAEPTDTLGGSATASSGPSGTSPGAGASPTVEPTGVPWDGTTRLNILLLGVDHRPGGNYLNTDTMIVVSIDPVTRRVALLSLPRDTIDVPLPAKWAAASYFGGSYPGKINALWSLATDSPNLFPGTTASRGYTAIKGALGDLYKLDIQYYVEVDFAGFREVVDTLGGVTVDVQSPVQDDHYPVTDSRALRLYIAPGFHHFDGVDALAYARSRHGSSDFDRAQRQQRLVLSLRQQLDPVQLLQPGRLEALVGALKDAVHTDIPAELFPNLVTLASSVDLAHARTLVFTPPYYETDDGAPLFTLTPFVDRIRRAAANAFKVDATLEASRAKIADEAATVWVLDGSGKVGQAGAVSDYLAYLGMQSSIPTSNGGRADRLDYAATSITAFNGAELRLPETIRVMAATFGVPVVARTDPSVTADIVVITGANTPKLVVP